MEVQNEEIRRCGCPGCNKPVYRSNKIFCSLQHKNAYHYLELREKNRLYKIPERKLHHNNNVLKKYYGLSRSEAFINQSPLILDGLDTRFYTRTMKNNKTGETLYVIYDFGFVIDSMKQIKIHFHDGGFPII